MVTDKHNSDIRSSAVLALAKVFEAVVDAVKKGFLPPAAANEPLVSCVGKILESLKNEVNSISRGCAADALRDILLAAYESGEECPVAATRQGFVCNVDANQAKVCAIHPVLRFPPNRTLPRLL